MDGEQAIAGVVDSRTDPAPVVNRIITRSRSFVQSPSRSPASSTKPEMNRLKRADGRSGVKGGRLRRRVLFEAAINEDVQRVSTTRCQMEQVHGPRGHVPPLSWPMNERPRISMPRQKVNDHAEYTANRSSTKMQSSTRPRERERPILTRCQLQGATSVPRVIRRAKELSP